MRARSAADNARVEINAASPSLNAVSAAPGSKDLLQTEGGSRPPVEEVVCRGVASFNLRYYDGYDWLPDWQAENLASSWAQTLFPRRRKISRSSAAAREPFTSEVSPPPCNPPRQAIN